MLNHWQIWILMQAGVVQNHNCWHSFFFIETLGPCFIFLFILCYYLKNQPKLNFLIYVFFLLMVRFFKFTTVVQIMCQNSFIKNKIDELHSHSYKREMKTYENSRYYMHLKFFTIVKNQCNVILIFNVLFLEMLRVKNLLNIIYNFNCFLFPVWSLSRWFVSRYLSWYSCHFCWWVDWGERCWSSFGTKNILFCYNWDVILIFVF